MTWPRRLAEIHHDTRPGDVAVVEAESARENPGGVPSLTDLLVGAGFEPAGADTDEPATATRVRSLPDTVGPGMSLLVCGLNPSLYAADAGVGFARPGNRFWPAALASGLVTDDRDPLAALDRSVGMTDLVKRATAKAEELSADEYRDGLARVERLTAWLQPGAVCFVGLAGWRAAVDRHATAGVQPSDLGGRPVYVMGSTSGLNAHTTVDDCADHLRAAAKLGAQGR
ncbi:MAG: mismatch-specific DNA-glycosylase [Acidimicrobiia bacterium]